MKLARVLVTSTALLIASAAQADSYFALSLGSAAYETSAFDPPFDDGLSETDTAIGVAVGFWLTDSVAIELGYADYGKASGVIYTESGVIPVSPFPSYDYEEQADLEATALQVAAVVNLNLSDSVGLVLTAGIENWEASGAYRFTFSDSTGFQDEGVYAEGEDDNSDLFYGIGLVFSLSESIDLSLVYDLHDFDTELLDSIEIKQTKAKISFNI